VSWTPTGFDSVPGLAFIDNGDQTFTIDLTIAEAVDGSYDTTVELVNADSTHLYTFKI